MNELIQQVRALAEAQRWQGQTRGVVFVRPQTVASIIPVPVEIGIALDFLALLRHLERAERIEKAARTIGPLGRALPPEITADARFDAIDEAVSALDAALSKEPQ